MDAGNDVLTSIGLFHTQEGAEAAISLQRDWFRDEWSSFRPLPPEVVAGAVLAQATVDGAVPAERRGLADRRHAAAVLPEGPWNGVERRAGSDRRAGGGPGRGAGDAGQAGRQGTARWGGAGGGGTPASRGGANAKQNGG